MRRWTSAMTHRARPAPTSASTTAERGSARRAAAARSRPRCATRGRERADPEPLRRRPRHRRRGRCDRHRWRRAGRRLPECGGEVADDGYCTTCGAKAAEPARPLHRAAGPLGGRRLRPRRAAHPQRGRGGRSPPTPNRAAAPCWSSATGSRPRPTPTWPAWPPPAPPVTCSPPRSPRGMGTTATRVGGDRRGARDGGGRGQRRRPRRTRPSGPRNPASCTFVAAVARRRPARRRLGRRQPRLLAARRRATRRAADASTTLRRRADRRTGVPRDEAETGPQAHAITRWLGIDAPDHTPRTASARAGRRPGWLLVCSDGLWNYCSEAARPRRPGPADCAASGRPSRSRSPVRWSTGPTRRAASDNITVALARDRATTRLTPPTPPTRPQPPRRPHRATTERKSRRWPVLRRRLPERVPARRGHRRARHRHRHLHRRGRGRPVRRGRRGRDHHRRHLRLDGRRQDRGGAARRPTAALDQILDGTWFAVIAGSHEARLAYPRRPASRHGADGPDAPAPTAKAAVARLPRRRRHGDGHLADAGRARLRVRARRYPAARHPADRRRRTSTRRPSSCARRSPARRAGSSATAAASAPTGRSTEVRRIATALLGTVDLIARARARWPPTSRPMMQPSMGRGVANGDAAGVGAAGRRRCCSSARSSPTVEDLTGAAPGGQPADRRLPDRRRGATSPATTTSPCGWPPRRSARSSSPPGCSWPSATRSSPRAWSRRMWSNDDTLTTRINPAVAHYTGQAELAEAIQDGLAAKAAGDDATATAKLGRAVQLAAETGNDEATTRLRKVVDIEDADTGTVRLKPGGRQARRDGARHRLDQDHPGARSEREPPARTGTQSTADDYCDTCGAPIAAAGARRPGRRPAALRPRRPGPARRPGARRAAGHRRADLPQLRAPRTPADALFCEACGYDFTTGTMPRPPDARRTAPDRPGRRAAARPHRAPSRHRSHRTPPAERGGPGRARRAGRVGGRGVGRPRLVRRAGERGARAPHRGCRRSSRCRGRAS